MSTKQTVVIDSKGTVPVFSGGEMRRVECGKPVSLSSDEIQYLKAGGIKFSAEKAGKGK